MANFWWQKLFLPAKTIFASPVFTMEKNVFSIDWRKLANPDYSVFGRILKNPYLVQP